MDRWPGFHKKRTHEPTQEPRSNGPPATVVIGGLITSTMLKLLVLPTLDKWIEERWERKLGGANPYR
jgi:hypothetical protein